MSRRRRRKKRKPAWPWAGPWLSARSRADLRHHPLVAWARGLSRRLGLWAVGHFIAGSVEALWRSRAWTTFAVAIIALSLATGGAFLLVAENLGAVLGRMSSLELSVYLADEATPAEVEAVGRELAALPEVVAVRHISRDQALALFRAANPELAPIAAELGENPLPASFEVSLAREARTAPALAALAARIEALPGVDSLGRDLERAERVLAASRVVGAIALFLGGVLLLSALFTVSNVVKLTIYARRDEVEILRLVGATEAYVRGMFVTEGLLQGLLGSLLALVGLYAAYRAAGTWLVQAGVPLVATLTTRFLTPPSVLLIVVAGTLLGGVGSLLPLRRLGRA